MISNHSFKEELDFQEVNGLLIIQAEFDGVVRDFIFDTGSSIILDKDFASSLNVQKSGKVKTRDSNNNKQHIQHVKLEKFIIGEVSFYDRVASVSDLEHLNTAVCLNVSGIIGANAMNKCIWQIDYQKQKITFTNHRDSLLLSGKEQQINFSAVGKGVPTVSLYSNGTYWGEAIFDTGSNGGLSLNEQ